MIQCSGTGVGYRCEISGEGGEQRLIADVMPAEGGNGSGFRPHELLEAGLGACMTITLQMIAEREGVKIQPAVTVELRRTEEKSVFAYAIDFRAENLDPALREKMLQKIARCPVAKTLGKAIEFLPLG